MLKTWLKLVKVGRVHTGLAKRDISFVHKMLYTEKGGGYGPNYDELAEKYIDKNGYVSYWDDEAKAPFLFNGSTFISYDDERSLSCKCKYVKEEGIGGIFYWCHTGDTSGVLLRRIGEKMKK